MQHTCRRRVPFKYMPRSLLSCDACVLIAIGVLIASLGVVASTDESEAVSPFVPVIDIDASALPPFDTSTASIAELAERARAVLALHARRSTGAGSGVRTAAELAELERQAKAQYLVPESPASTLCDDVESCAAHATSDDVFQRDVRH